MMTPVRNSFKTTTSGLNRQSPPLRLFEKAKRLGVWNPSDLDFSQDQQDWHTLSETEQEVILHLTSLFQAGEEAVTLDLLPLMMVVAQEGRIEEEMYLTTFLFEEAKHTDFFGRFLEEVTGGPQDFTRFQDDNYRHIFYQALPQALNALRSDSSPTAQARASATYNMIVEGILAETGYHAYYEMLERNDLMPALREGVGLLKRDESRHIAYGVFLLSRLVAEHPSVWEVVELQMNTLLVPALGLVQEMFARYDPVPFGLKEDDFMNYAMGQFQKRYSRLERAKNATLDEVYQTTNQVIQNDDA